MKVWTMLAGLAVAGILVSSVFAQDAPKKKGKKGGMAPPAYDKIVAGDVGLKDGDDVTVDIFTAYLKKNVPADAPEGTADRVAQRAPQIFSRIAQGAGQPADAKSLKKDDYTKGIANMPARGKKKKSA